MKKETKAQFKKRVLRIAKEMFEYMELGNYRINIKFRDDMGDNAMTISPSLEYNDADLFVSLSIKDDNYTDDHLRWLVCHELCHTHTHNMFCIANDNIHNQLREPLRIAHEKMTESFSRLIVKGLGIKLNGIKTDFE